MGGTEIGGASFIRCESRGAWRKDGVDSESEWNEARQTGDDVPVGIRRAERESGRSA